MDSLTSGGMRMYGDDGRKGSGGFWKKLLICITLGLVIGLFAGVGFLGVTGSHNLVKSVWDNQRVEEWIHDVARELGIDDFLADTKSKEQTEEEAIAQVPEEVFDEPFMEEHSPESEISETQLPETEMQETETHDTASGIEKQTVTAVVTDVTDIVERVMPAMVSIVNVYTVQTSYFGRVYSEEAQASGSGIVIGENDTELLIATNYHVVEQAESLLVTFVNENQVEAVVKGSDANMDLAVIAIPLASIDEATKGQIAIAQMGDSDALSIGEPAIAIGNALGYGQSVTTGVISALNRHLESYDGTVSGPFIQTDAAINPGNSGGALLNVRGELIGINSNKIGGDRIEGMGYAIPISAARPILDELMSLETRIVVPKEERGYIGITGVNISKEEASRYNMPLGVYISQVIDASAAEAAGLKKGDIIVGIGGVEITSMAQLKKELEYYRAGDRVILSVMKMSDGGYENVKIDLTLGINR